VNAATSWPDGRSAWRWPASSPGGLTSFIALITGIIAFIQIAASGQRGLGTAITGFVLGLIITGGWSAFIIAVILSALGS